MAFIYLIGYTTRGIQDAFIGVCTWDYLGGSLLIDGYIGLGFAPAWIG